MDTAFTEFRNNHADITEKHRDLADRWRNGHLELDAREKELRASYQSHVKTTQEKLTLAEQRHGDVLSKIDNTALALDTKHEQLHENVHQLKNRHAESTNSFDIKFVEVKQIQEEHSEKLGEESRRLGKEINETRAYQDQKLKEVHLSNDKRHRENQHTTESKIAEVRGAMDGKYNEFERAFHLSKAELERSVNTVHVKAHGRLEELAVKLNHIHEQLGNDLSTAKEQLTALFHDELMTKDENRQRDARKLQHAFDKLNEQIASTDVQVRESILELKNKVFEGERYQENQDRDFKKLFDAVNDQITQLKLRQQDTTDGFADETKKILQDSKESIKDLEQRMTRRSDEQAHIIEDLTERLLGHKKNLAEQQGIFSNLADEHAKRLQDQLERHRSDHADMIDAHGKHHIDSLKTVEGRSQEEVQRLTRRLEQLQDLAAEALELGKKGQTARDRMAHSSDTNFEALRTALETRTDELKHSIEKVQADVHTQIDHEANVRSDMSKTWSSHLKEVGDGHVVAVQAMETLQKRLELLEKAFENNRMATSDEIVNARRDAGDLKNGLQQSIREARGDNQASIAENMVAVAEKQLRTEEQIHELRRMVDTVKAEHSEALAARMVAVEDSNKARLENSLVGVESATAHSVSVAEERIKTFFESHRATLTARQDHLQTDMERMVNDAKEASERQARARETSLQSHIHALTQDIRELQTIADQKEAQRLMQAPSPEMLKMQSQMEDMNSRCELLTKQNAELVGKVDQLTHELNSVDTRDKQLRRAVDDMEDHMNNSRKDTGQFREEMTKRTPIQISVVISKSKS